MNLQRAALSLALGMALGACASSTRSDTPFSTSRDRPDEVQIVVQNLNFADARLYTIRRGTRVRLGTVNGKQDAEFTLRWPMSDVLSIEIDLLAGPTCATRQMQVDPGDILELQIAVAFRQSSFCR